MGACGGRKIELRGRTGDIRPDPVFVEASGSIFLVGGSGAGYQGTGFLLDYKGRTYLITNFHVISLVKDVFIETEEKTVYKDLSVLATDRANDVAVLEVKGLPASMKGLSFTHDYATSQRIFVIGYPDMRSKENHVNFGPGVISDASYLAPVYIGEGDCRNIQITSPISPGHSGSPVLDDKARVIGVVAWGFGPEADLQRGNYAVPFEHVESLLKEIESRAQDDPAAAYAAGAPCTGDADCPWIYLCIEGACRFLKDFGDSCTVDDDCFLPYICKTGACSKAGTLGDACRGDSQCEPPYWCILDTCRLLGKKGDACGVDIDCEEPLYCVAATCAKELISLDGPCAATPDCYAPNECIGGKCKPPPPKPYLPGLQNVLE